MKIVILDRKTLGNDVNVDIFNKFGEVEVFDIISIHCPLNEQTKDLLNYENMKIWKIEQYC